MTPSVDAPIALVVVPARDEERTIGLLLSDLDADPERHRLAVTVVCNGCRDATAAVARGFGGTTVLEIAEASKPRAINAALDGAPGLPVVVVDADVRLSPGAVSATVAALRAGASAAAPRIELEPPPGASGAVRRFVAVWAHAPYFGDGLVGAGFYAVDAATASRLFPLPDVAADDLFVLGSVPRSRRVTVHQASFSPRLPSRIGELLDAETRHIRARRAVRRSRGAPADELSPGGRRWLWHAVRREGVLSGAVFAAVRAWTSTAARLGDAAGGWRTTR